MRWEQAHARVMICGRFPRSQVCRMCVAVIDLRKKGIAQRAQAGVGQTRNLKRYVTRGGPREILHFVQDDGRRSQVNGFGDSKCINSSHRLEACATVPRSQFGQLGVIGFPTCWGSLRGPELAQHGGAAVYHDGLAGDIVEIGAHQGQHHWRDIILGVAVAAQRHVR